MNSMDRTDCRKFPCISSYAQVFKYKIYGPQKRQFSIFLTFFESFEFSQKLLFQIWGFGSIG